MNICYQILVSKPDPGGERGADSSWEAQGVLSRTVAACRRELPQAQLLNSSTDPGEKNIPSPL